MPTPKLCFQEQNHQNLEHSIIFQNTSANVSPQLWNKSSYQILRENHRAIHCAPPLPIPRSWERCLPITLDCPPVQSFHYSTANFRVHASVTFLINGDERPLLMVCFLKCLEASLFRWKQFCRCMINRLGHDFPQTQNIFTNGTLILKIYSACSFADTMFSSGNFGEIFSCFMSFAHMQSTSKSKYAYFYLSHTHKASKSGSVKFQHKSFSYSRGRSERPCLFVFRISGTPYWFWWFSRINTV